MGTKNMSTVYLVFPKAPCPLLSPWTARRLWESTVSVQVSEVPESIVDPPGCPRATLGYVSPDILGLMILEITCDRVLGPTCATGLFPDAVK
jgi:hypothetical protein